MKKPQPSDAKAYYRAHRRENFAASQRLEGIVTEVTRHDNKTPLPSKAVLRKKYAVHG